MTRIVLSAADCKRIYGEPPHVILRPIDMRSVEPGVRSWITSAHMGEPGEFVGEVEFRGNYETHPFFVRRVQCPIKVGETFWVAESFVRPNGRDRHEVVYLHDTDGRYGLSCRSAVQMTRAESRATVTVRSVAVTKEEPWMWVVGAAVERTDK